MRALDPVLVVGALISVTVAVIFYVRPDTKSAFGVFAGLLCAALTLQIQTITMERRHMVADARRQRTLDAIDSISWLPDVLDSILESATRVERQFGATPAAEAFRNSFQSCLAALADLERGHFTMPYGDLSMTYSLTRNCRKTLWATSVQDIDLSWWTSPKSQTYWTLQQDALRRGVSITRVFIYTTLTDELERLAGVQRDAGLNILLVDGKQLPPQLKTDIVIWDESCAYETRSNASGEPILNFYTVSQQDVQNMVHQFQRILSNAKNS
ncbi:hypothetical protein [Nocardia thraciensis]